MSNYLSLEQELRYMSYTLCQVLPVLLVHESLIRQELPMRCFFHLLSGDDTILDSQGLEVSDLQEAEEQALEAIQEVRQEIESNHEDLKGWHLHVVDGSGVTLMSIPLDALTQ